MKAIPLTAFAAVVNAAIVQVPESGWFGTRKVFVSAIWQALSDVDGARMSLDCFKRRLIEANRAQLLSLARADLVAAMPTTAVADSEIEHYGATYHFVVDGRAREAWA